MAVTTEEVKYIFTGDTSSLSESTTQAIGLLDQYANEIKKIVKQAKEVSQVSEQVKKSSATFSLLTESVKKAASAMKNLNSSKVNFDSAKKDIATFTATVMMKVATIRYQFDTITMKMQAIKSKAASTFPQLSKFVGTAASAFRRVAKAVSEDSDHILKNIQVTKLLKTAKQQLINTSSKLVAYFKNVATSVREATEQFRGLRLQGIGLKSLFQVLTGYQLGKVFVSGFREALHYVEVLNMFNVILDSSTDEVKKFVDAAQEMYGLDPTTIMKMTSEFYNLATAVDAPTEAAKKMSEGLTKTALDLSSLFDIDIDKVAQDLTAGMQGMTRAVRKYGLDLRMTTLEQTALNYGLKINAATTSEANRQALRYLTIVKQASRATGDFAKTIESPANQLRILKEQFSQLARAIGNFFLPVLQKVLPYLNGIVMAIRTILQFFAQLLGIGDISFGGMTDAAKDMDDVTNSVNGIGDALDSTKKKVKQLLAPFDELNILQEDQSQNTAAGGAGVGEDLLDPTLMKALEDVKVELEEVRMKANDVRDAILGFFGLSWDKQGKLTFDASQFEENLINKFPSWTQTITAVFDNWQGIADGVAVVWDALGTSMKSVFTGISQGFTNMIQAMNLDSLVADWVTALPDNLQSIADWLNDNQSVFETFGQYIAYVGTAFATWKIISTVMTPIVSLVTTLMKLNPAVLGLVAGLAAIVIGFKNAYNSSDRFRGMVGELKESFGGMVESVIVLMQSLWDVISPVLSEIGGAISDLWTNYVAPIVVNLATIITEIITIISGILTFLLDTFGPQLSTILQTVVGIVQSVLQVIFGVIDGLLQVLKGVLQFISGVFSGDWKKAWEGIKNIFKGVLNVMITLFEGMVNLVISLANSLISLIVGAVASMVNAVAGAIQSVVDFLGIGWTVPTIGSVPKIPTVTIPRLAEGGVVDSPTLSLIGEGKYPEAVVPLGNSPQMQELIDKIAESIDNKPDDDDTPIQVTMYLDGNKIYKSTQKASRKRGVDFKMGAFER